MRAFLIWLYIKSINTKSRYEELKQQIHFHNYRYHVLDAPVISDLEFDKLLNELKRIEADHPDWITDDSPRAAPGPSLLTASKRSLTLRQSSRLQMPSVPTMRAAGLSASRESMTVWKKQSSSSSRRLMVYPLFCIITMGSLYKARRAATGKSVRISRRICGQCKRFPCESLSMKRGPDRQRFWWFEAKRLCRSRNLKS